MRGNILLIPKKESKKVLQEIKDPLYSGGYRFSTKPKASPAHISMAQFSVTQDSIPNLIELLKNTDLGGEFTIKNTEWELTNKPQRPNHMTDQPYHWIALTFHRNPKLVHLYNSLSLILTKLEINDTERYVDNVKKVKFQTDGLKASEIEDLDCIANHLNLSSVTRPEKAQDALEHIQKSIPTSITFDRLYIIQEDKGKVGEVTI